MENLRINNDVGGGQAGSNGSGDGNGHGQQMPPPQPMAMPMDMQQGMSGSHQAGPLAQRSGGGNGILGGGGNGNGNGMGGGNGGGIPQLPPQMFTTAASLLDLTDKKLMVALRDGRKLIGVLRSWDQFGNLVLQDAVERLFCENLYADLPAGIFLVRGENIQLMGEIDLDKDDDVPEPYRLAPVEEVHALQKKEKERQKRLDGVRQKRLRDLGFEYEHSGEAII